MASNIITNLLFYFHSPAKQFVNHCTRKSISLANLLTSIGNMSYSVLGGNVITNLVLIFTTRLPRQHIGICLINRSGFMQPRGPVIIYDRGRNL